MSIIDSAITRIRELVLLCTDINSAPAYPTEAVTTIPQALTWIGEGSVSADNATTVRLLYTLKCNIYFAATDLGRAFQQINTFIPEFSKRLAGDATLNASVSTIVYPALFSVGAQEHAGVPYEVVTFSIPIKIMETPTT